jgi:GT2 family glycosyltransferase
VGPHRPAPRNVAHVTPGPAALAEPDDRFTVTAQLIRLLGREKLANRDLRIEIGEVYGSNTWRLVKRLRRCRELLLPAGTFRERLWAAGVRGLWSSPRDRRRAWRALFFGTDLAADEPVAPPEPCPRSEIDADQYQLWIEQNEPGSAELAEQRRAAFAYQPKISVLVVTADPPRPRFAATVQSVLDQTYAHWELCVVHRGDPGDVREQLRELAGDDRRVKLRCHPAGRDEADSWNAALALAEGEFVAPVRAEDLLAPFALFEVVRSLNQTALADLLYSDEDLLQDADGRRVEPRFKPDWAPDTLRGQNYIGHLLVPRRDLLAAVGGFRAGFAGLDDFDLILRASERATRIVHLPKVLYHGRQNSPRDEAARGAWGEAASRAVGEHLAHSGLTGRVAAGSTPGTLRVTYALVRKPCVSILIPNKDQAEMLGRCLRSLARSTYPDYEVVVIENNSTEAETFRTYEQFARDPRVRVIRWRHSFNYSALNNFAARRARGEILVFLNNDVEVITADWLEGMLQYAQRPDVGAVGAKLYYPDGTLQHAGVIVGLGGVAAHLHRSCRRDDPGYGGRAVTVQNLSAVTAACMMTRKDVFNEVGGFDEHFGTALNDVDLCLSIRQARYLVVWSPFVELYHAESKTRGQDDSPEKIATYYGEAELFRHKWRAFLERGDPYFNPNLSLEPHRFGLRIGQ